MALFSTVVVEVVGPEHKDWGFVVDGATTGDARVEDAVNEDEVVVVRIAKVVRDALSRRF